MSITHGTTSAYAHGCRCAECRAARAAYCREYRHRLGAQPRGNPVAVGKMIFKSQVEAAAALGISERTVAYHLDRYGDLTHIGKPAKRPFSFRAKPIRIGHRTWPSRSALADYVGCPIETVRGWLRRNDNQRLLAAIMKADAKVAHAEIKAREAA